MTDQQKIDYLIKALEWALLYVRMPNNVTPELFAKSYNTAVEALRLARGIENQKRSA